MLLRRSPVILQILQILQSCQSLLVLATGAPNDALGPGKCNELP